ALIDRLADYKFNCFYYETTSAIPMNSDQEYTLEEARKMIENSLEKNTYKVKFNGADPLAQSEAVAEMAKFIQLKKIPTYLESSCYYCAKFVQVLTYIDFIKIEFKTPDSEFVDSKHYSKLLENELECLKLAVKSKKVTYIKVVVSAKTEVNPFKELLKKVFEIAQKSSLAGFIIQPSYGIAEPSLEQLLSFYDDVHAYYNEVRIVPQLHKFIGAP